MVIKKRQIFFIYHLLFSIFVIGLALIFIFLFWYPVPLVKATGVMDIIFILFGVNIIIGPILGWLIYKEGKKTLKFDLIVIILLQSGALCFGIFSVEQGRPIWIAYTVDRFELVRKNELIQDNLKEAQPQFQKSSWLKPQFVAVEFSRDKKQRNDEMFAEIFDGISVAQRPERYVELTQAKTQIQQRALPLKELEQYNSKTEVERTLAKYPEANAWLPLKANAVDMVVLIDKEKAEVIRIVNLRPWN